MKFTTILPLLSTFFVAFLGWIVLIKARKNRISFTFVLFSLTISIWMFGTFMMFLERSNISDIIFWDKFVYIGVIYIPAIMYHFGLALTKNKKTISKKILFFGYTLSTFFLILLPTKLFVNGVFIYKGGAHTKAQLFHHLFLVYFVFFIILWFVTVYKYYKVSRLSIERERIKYYFISFFILAFFGSLGYLPAYGIGIYPFEYLAGVVFVTILFYAIVRHRLMDIKLVLRKSTVLLLSLLTIFIPAFMAMTFFAYHIGNFSIWPNFFVLMIGVLIYPIVRNYYFQLANKYLFSSLYDSVQVVSEVSNGLKMILDVNKTYQFINAVFTKIFHLKSFYIFIADTEGEKYVIKYKKGVKIKKPDVFLRNSSLQKYFFQGETTIIVEELQSNYSNKDAKELVDFLTKLGVEIVVPLNVKNKNIGLLALGAKESGDMYNSEDLQILDTISAQLGVSINNAQLYTEVKDFNVKLRKEIVRATSKLQTTNNRLQIMANRLAQANDQLRKLDNAKTEFISIASHQLRTPLTAVKGFVSLLLEGSYGKLSKEIKSTLNKVYLSNERLIQLVEDLLNVSKIEAGRMDYQFEKTQLIDVCRELFDTFIIRAKERRLKLELKISSKKIPEVMTDRNKIREVISNLIDNAIKYTLKGGVIVKITSSNNRVQIAIIDTGIGVPAEETPYLFQKFSRGKDISRLNTGGTGLGLHVGKKIMEALHGKIWLESAGTNKGSTFFIEVPIEILKIKNNKKDNKIY